MRVVILTSMRNNIASRCLPFFLEHPEIDVAMIVFNQGGTVNRKRHYKRLFRKVRRIGLLGAINGIRMRSWYSGDPQEDLFEVAERCGIRLETTPHINARRTAELFRESGAELGLSLGNPYIGPRVFRTPRYGMLNVHGEILPRFQGAASVVWPIYEGITETGFTVHQIDKGIDTGAIVYQQRFPIEFKPTLAETIGHNSQEIARRVPAALVEIVADYERFHAGARVQTGGESYTTPTFRQFLRMVRQHRRLYRESISG